jgi:DNA-binding NarL/FixJ family response regulator
MIKLTPRERQIFDMITTQAFGNLEIANILGVSEAMVKKHTTSILQKHKVKNRLELAVFCRDLHA